MKRIALRNAVANIIANSGASRRRGPLLPGDDYYARELVVAAAQAYVKRLHTPRGD